MPKNLERAQFKVIEAGDGLDSEESEMALIEAGANDFVSKSSSPALVVARVKRLLG